MGEFYKKTSNYAVTVGQFGEVYRAKMGSRAVAVKIVKQYSSKKVMEQFEREMNIMSQVSHTNIVTLFGIIREGITYLVIHNSYQLYQLHFIKAFPAGPILQQ